MFSVQTTPEKSENKTQQSLAVILDLCLRKTRAGKSHDYRKVIVFEKLRFHNVFRPHENSKPTFSDFTGLKSVFEKLRFLHGFTHRSIIIIIVTIMIIIVTKQIIVTIIIILTLVKRLSSSAQGASQYFNNTTNSDL